MSNDGPNRGRGMRPNIKRFAFNLLTTLQKTTGLSYRALDRALDYPAATDSRTEAYISDNPNTSRALQSAALQDLERRAARMLGRPEFKIVVRNIGTGPLIGGNGSLLPVGVPAEYTLPRTPRETKRDSLLITYERFADYVMQGYGENYPPPMEDVTIYLYEIEGESGEQDSGSAEELHRQDWATNRREWVVQFMNPSAGILPESPSKTV